MNNNNSQVKIYIDSSKSYFNPGETFSASIKLEVLEEVNSNKILIIAKGKQIIKAIQNRLLQTDDYSDDDFDYEDEESESDFDSTFKDNSDEIYSTNSKDNKIKNKKGIIDINETKEIFKYKRVVQISDNEYLSKGIHIFPIIFELPDDLPGSFLFLESNVYVEVIYTIKVKLNNINIKQSFPFIIRQNEQIFNYRNSSDYEKNISGCCCEVITTKIKVNLNEKYILDESEIKINVILENSKCKLAGSPIIIEIYQELVLYPFDRNKKIKVTKIVGKYIGEKPVEPKKDYNLNITIPLDISQYMQENLSKTKAYKYFKNKSLISLLGQSLKSESISSKYEIYAESKFANVSIDDLGVFVSTIIYPPEKGIFPNIDEIRNLKEITNKTIYLNKRNINMDEDSDFEKDKNKVDKNKDKNKDKDKIKSEKDKASDNSSNEESSSISNQKEKSKEKNSSESENSDNLKNDEKKNNNSDNVKHKISFESSNNENNKYSITDNGSSKSIKKKFDRSFLDDGLDNVILNTDSTK